jgi:hypothetical protein
VPAPHRLLPYRYYSGSQVASNRMVKLKQNTSQHCAPLRRVQHDRCVGLFNPYRWAEGRCKLVEAAVAVRRKLKVKAKRLDRYDRYRKLLPTTAAAS